MEGWREGREVTELAEGEREALIRHSDLEDERRVPACEYASERASTQTRPSAPPQRLRSPHISPLIPATINKSKTRSTDDWPQWSPEGPAELPLALIGCRKKKKEKKRKKRTSSRAVPDTLQTLRLHLSCRSSGAFQPFRDVFSRWCMDQDFIRVVNT